MPGGDGTGPLGQGPMTGRGAGACAGYDTPGYTNAGPRHAFGSRGFGRGGGGRGWRHWFFATGVPGWARFGLGVTSALAGQTKDAESSALQSHVKILQQQLDAVKRRLDALRSETER